MTRAVFHRLSLAILFLVALAVIDAFLGVLEPPNLFRLARGQTVPVSGDLTSPPIIGTRMGEDPTVEQVRAVLAYETDSPDLSLSLLELKGRMWRGELAAKTTAKSGQFGIKVYNQADPGEEEPVFVVRLFPDEAALRADLPSFSARYLGVRPLWLAFLGLVLGLGLLALSFVRSGREEAELQAQGIGSIYKLAKRKDEWEIIFGLGSEHGVHPGDRLLLLDRQRNVVGELTASRVGLDGSHATLPLDADVRPGYFVALAHAAQP